MSLITIACLLFGLAFLGVPIAWALGAVGLLGVILADVPLTVVPHMTYGSAESYSMVAIPMFMLMGAIIEKAGLGYFLVNFASSVVGWARGGLAQVNVISSMFFGGLSGAATADVASIGVVLIPEMKRHGYPANFAAACTSSTAELSIIIPPSIVLIVYGAVASVSVGKMFIAGFIPGLVLGGTYMFMCWFFSWKNNWPVHEEFRIRRVIATGIDAAGAIVIPVVVMGGILGGIFTATEASAIGVVITVLLVAALYRQGITWHNVADILVTTVRRTGIIMMVIAASGTLAWYMSHQQIPQKLAARMLEFSDNPYIILLIIILFLTFLGTILSGVPAIIIVVPVVMPILTQIGVDPIHFGIIFALAICAGSQTPPVAATMLLTTVIAKISIGEMWKANKWFVLANFIVLVLVTYVPPIAMWLPNLLYPE